MSQEQQDLTSLDLAGIYLGAGIFPPSSDFVATNPRPSASVSQGRGGPTAEHGYVSTLSFFAFLPDLFEYISKAGS